jgi:transcriptional regulator of acetoin/glycerol metabolism
LVNALEYALVHADSAAILPRHFPAELREALPAPIVSEGKSDALLTRYYRGSAAEREKELILAALAEAGGNKSTAAEKLGMSRTTLWKRLKQYGIADDTPVSGADLKET